LKSSGYVNREIYLVGDMQKSEFRNPVRLSVPPQSRIFFVRTDESPNDNLSVPNVALLNPVVELNSAAQVEATVTNNDGSDKSGVVVSLYMNNKKVAQSVVDIAAGASRESYSRSTFPRRAIRRELCGWTTTRFKVTTVSIFLLRNSKAERSRS